MEGDVGCVWGCVWDCFSKDGTSVAIAPCVVVSLLCPGLSALVFSSLYTFSLIDIDIQVDHLHCF